MDEHSNELAWLRVQFLKLACLDLPNATVEQRIARAVEYESYALSPPLEEETIQ